MSHKNKSDFRPLLQLDGSLYSTMRIKMTIPEDLTPCFRWKPSKERLKQCPSSTRIYNEKNGSYQKNDEHYIVTCYSVLL